VAMYYCGCDRWVDNDYDPMDDAGDCGACQEEKEHGPVEQLVTVALKGVTYAFKSAEYARQGLNDDPLLWCSMAVDNDTNKLLKGKGNVVPPLPTYH
jgi:hypothetical protein